MKELVYLKNGQQAYLVEKTASGKFVVEPIIEATDSEGNEYDYTNPPTIVDEIFKVAPVEKIDAEIKSKQAQSAELTKTMQGVNAELSAARNELHRAKTELTNIAKSRIDLSQFRTCKSFAFFVKDMVTPVVIGDMKKLYSGRKFKLSFYVDMHDGKTTKWVSSIQHEHESWSAGSDHKIDEEYGFMFDMTEEDLIKIAKERSEKIDLSKLHYSQRGNSGIPEKFRTERIAQHIEATEKADRLRRMERLIKEVSDKQDELFKLTNEHNELESLTPQNQNS